MSQSFSAFVINMKRNPERLDFMTKQLDAADIEFSVQEGFDGKTYDFSKEYDESAAIILNGSTLTPSEKGCALSHRRILETITQKNIEYTLILEDDVEIPTNFKSIIEELIINNKKKKVWEYLSFNYPYVGLRYIQLWLYLMKNKYKEDRTLSNILKTPIYFFKFILVSIFSLYEGFREHFYKKKSHTGKPVTFYRPLYLAGCYLIHQEGAKKILSLGGKIIYPADRVQNIARFKKNLRVRAFCPMIVRQRRDKFKSTLNDQDLSGVMGILV
ncbi:MAG: glycosyltransferase family 25 protein [Candidatus Pacebacteria bacterium]|nr:glycosyltransferase family 25 protein [Candidatus Paceibacterota bacterium]